MAPFLWVWSRFYTYCATLPILQWSLRQNSKVRLSFPHIADCSLITAAEASEIAASVFFSKLFGDSKAAANVLNFLVLLSSFGNLLAVLIGSSRMLREIGR